METNTKKVASVYDARLLIKESKTVKVGSAVSLKDKDSPCKAIQRNYTE